MKTLLFCTSFARTPQSWEARYRKWFDHASRGRLKRDQILLVDDGSPVLPSWRGLKILEALPDRQPAEPQVLYHFPNNLGRQGVRTYPGWFRSFCFAATYARQYGFEKVVHLESDCFLYSERIVDYLNGLSSGWTALWCPRWNCPETCIQVVCADQLERYAALAVEPGVEKRMEVEGAEMVLPFTAVCKDFIGDRYGEFAAWVPEEADYGCQILEDWPV